MDSNQIVESANTKLKSATDHFIDELKKIRTGRAHGSMLDGIMVTAYGVAMPINQVGNITAPEAQLLQITPFDPTNIQAISDAIRANQSLGLNPSDDGRVVRIPVPTLTTERRQEIVKQVGEKVEETHIVCRNVRHDSLDEIKKLKADKKIGDDEANRLEKQIDDLMSKNKLEIDNLAKTKEKEILTV